MPTNEGRQRAMPQHSGIYFGMPYLQQIIRCFVTREALNDKTGSSDFFPDVAIFDLHREEIEKIAAALLAEGKAPIVSSRDLNPLMFAGQGR
jgi:Protein of unknown function (DUF1488)